MIGDKIKKKYTEGIIFFAVVFISMCVLKLWYTLLLIFVYAILITLKNRKRNFCSAQCPLGVIQDYIYDKDKKAPKHNNRVIKTIFYSVFTAYIIFYMIYLYNMPYELWRRMFFLMLFSTSAALILQGIFGKRYWCINMCPLGSVLNTEMKLIRKSNHKKSS